MDFYTEDLSAIPYPILREMFIANDAPRPLAAFTAFFLRSCRKLGFAMTAQYGFTEQGAKVDRAQIAAVAKAKWAPVEEELDDLKFEHLAYCCPEVIGATERYMSYLLSGDRTTVASLLWQTCPGLPLSGAVEVEFHSYAESGTDIMSSRGDAIAVLLAAKCFNLPSLDIKYLKNRNPLRRYLSFIRNGFSENNCFC